MEIKIDDIRNDWRLLDREDFPKFQNIKLLSHEEFTSIPEISAEHVTPGAPAGFLKRWSIVASLLHAARLFKKADTRSVIIINGGCTHLWVWCGLLNALPIFGKKKLLCWDIFVEFILGTEKSLPFFPFLTIPIDLKEKFARFILRQYELNVVWSRKQVATHARHFNLPEDKFIFLPFKANHSKRETYDIPIGNYIFAGGNGKRDYACLIEAIRETNIPVIISATDPTVRKQIELLPNVIVVGAPEPAFAQLQAASRFVVIPMINSGLKGGGEANFCNAMWHGKPIIAVDSIAAEDYVVNGETGFIVPSGNDEQLRQRIIELWNNPSLCSEMGKLGHQHVADNFTHSQFIRRLLRLAFLTGSRTNE